MPYLIVSLLLVLSASGCFAPMLTVKHEGANRSALLVTVDGQPRGTISPGDKHASELSPGPHRISVCAPEQEGRCEAAFRVVVEDDVNITIHETGFADATATSP